MKVFGLNESFYLPSFALLIIARCKRVHNTGADYTVGCEMIELLKYFFKKFSQHHHSTASENQNSMLSLTRSFVVVVVVKKKRFEHGIVDNILILKL